jgi:hypothetical protein
MTGRPFLERYANFVKLWEFTLPQVPLAPRETVIGWLAVYDDGEVESAVVALPYRLKRASVTQIIPDEVYKLASSLLKGARKSKYQSYNGRMR